MQQPMQQQQQQPMQPQQNIYNGKLGFIDNLVMKTQPQQYQQNQNIPQQQINFQQQPQQFGAMNNNIFNNNQQQNQGMSLQDQVKMYGLLNVTKQMKDKGDEILLQRKDKMSIDEWLDCQQNNTIKPKNELQQCQNLLYASIKDKHPISLNRQQQVQYVAKSMLTSTMPIQQSTQIQQIQGRYHLLEGYESSPSVDQLNQMDPLQLSNIENFTVTRYNPITQEIIGRITYLQPVDLNNVDLTAIQIEYGTFSINFGLLGDTYKLNQQCRVQLNNVKQIGSYDSFVQDLIEKCRLMQGQHISYENNVWTMQFNMWN